MNLFNRIFTTVTILVLTILGLGVIFLPENMLSMTTNLINFTRNLNAVGVRALIGILFFALMLFLIWLELRRPGARTVEVARSTGGRIRITTRHVEERLAQQVDALSGVISTRVRVNERDNAVDARLDVDAAPDIDLIAKGEEIAAIVRVAVQDQLGLKIYGKPQITLKTSKSKPVTITPVVAPNASASNSNHDSAPADRV